MFIFDVTKEKIMKKLSFDTALKLAAGLVDTDIENTNLEYNRGVCELLADLFPSESGEQNLEYRYNEISRILNVKIN